MMRTRIAHTVTVLSIATLPGCGGAAPAVPSAISVAGLWTGTISTYDGSDTLRLSLTQSDPQLGGTWSFSSAVADHSTQGVVAGTVRGAEVAVLLRSPDTECPVTMSGSINDAATEITGTFGRAACPPGVSGSGGQAWPIRLLRE